VNFNFEQLKEDRTRKCQASDWRMHKQDCKKKDNWEPKHKCGDCTVIQVKVRSEKKTEIECCPNLDWECQKYRIGKKTRTSHDFLTVILDGRKMGVGSHSVQKFIFVPGTNFFVPGTKSFLIKKQSHSVQKICTGYKNPVLS